MSYRNRPNKLRDRHAHPAASGHLSEPSPQGSPNLTGAEAAADQRPAVSPRTNHAESTALPSGTNRPEAHPSLRRGAHTLDTTPGAHAREQRVRRRYLTNGKAA